LTYKKNFARPKPEKSYDEMFLTRAQVRQLLDCVKAQAGKFARRDHALIFFGFHLGLRVGETALLSRETFRHLDDGMLYVRRLKSIPRVPFQCKTCGRRVNVSADKAGENFSCCRCGASSPVPHPARKIDPNPPEKMPPVVEAHVIDYAHEYLSHMRPDQNWLFEGGTEDGHISPEHIRRIFAHYVLACGLSAKYSPHALRHGRGVFILESFNDPVMLRDSLGQKSLRASEFYMRLSPSRREQYRSVLDKQSEPMAF